MTYDTESANQGNFNHVSAQAAQTIGSHFAQSEFRDVSVGQMQPNELINRWHDNGAVVSAAAIPTSETSALPFQPQRALETTWSQQDLLNRIRDLMPQGAPLPELDLESVARAVTSLRSSINQTRGVGDELIELALASVLRVQSLSPLLVVGSGDGPAIEWRPDMPTALHSAEKREVGLIWRLAAQCFREHGQVPGKEALLVRVIDQISSDDEFGLLDEREARDLLDYCFGDECASLDVETSRQTVVQVMVEFLSYRPMSKLLDNWKRGGGVVPEHYERAIRLHAELTDDRGTTPRLRGLSITDLFATASPPQWHVRQLFVKGETAFIAGPVKSLKSGLALDLAVSLASRRDGSMEPQFLNRFPCEPARHVLLFSVESGPWVTRQRISSICASKPMPLPMGDRRSRDSSLPSYQGLNLTCYFDPPRLAIKQDQIILRREIRAHGAEVVIFDPIYLMLLAGTKTEASNVFQMGETFRAIEDVCKSEGATPFFVHHFNKAVRPGTPPSLKDMSFAGAAEMAAQWLLVNHRVEYDPVNGHCRLTMCVGGRSGQSGKYGVDIIEGQLADDFTGRHWQVEVMSEGEAQDRDGARRTDGGRHESSSFAMAEQRIVVHLAQQPLGTARCFTPLVDAVRGRTNLVRRALDALLLARRVEEVAIVAASRPRDAYRLSETEWRLHNPGADVDGVDQA